MICRCRLAVWRQLPKLFPASSTLVTCSKKKTHPSWVLFFLEDKAFTDESRGWSREWERALCLTGLGFRWLVRQRRQLIIAERGAPLKAQVRPVAPKKIRLVFTDRIFFFRFSGRTLLITQIVYKAVNIRPPLRTKYTANR